MKFNAIVLSCALGCSALVSAGEAEAVDLSKTNKEPVPITKGEDDGKIKALIEKLGAADTVQREDAEKALSAAGAAAVPLLKEAATSANPEISVRAKRLLGRLAVPTVKANTYAEFLPADSVFFLEFPDAPKMLENLKKTPLGMFWQTPGMRKYLQGYRKDLLATELQADDALQALSKLATGKAMMAMASPDTIQVEEIDAPLLYAMDINNLQSVEAQARQLFDGMGDPIKSKRQFKQYTLDEQTNANTLFTQDRVVHGLTEKAIETMIDNLAKPPAKPLAAQLADLRAQRPNADWIVRLSTTGLKNLAEALQLIDSDQVELLDGFGLVEGSTIESAATFNAEGMEELTRVKPGGGAGNKSVLGILQRLPLAPAPANKQFASDLMPFQAALMLQINADVSKNAAEISAALLALDKLTGSPVHENAVPAPATPGDPAKKPDGGNTRVGDALNQGGGVVVDPKLADDKNKGAAKADKGGVVERSAPHIERLQKAGIQIEKLFEQAEGPMCLALFPEQVDVTRVTQVNPANAPTDPDRIPMSAVFAMTLKDSGPIEEGLARATRGTKILFKKIPMNGGFLYVDAEEGDEEGAAFWINGHYFAYGTSRDVLEIASAAAQNAKGNQRISARAEFQKHLAQRDPAALIDVFADSTLWLDMPYKMGQLGFQDQGNPLPEYAIAASFLKNNLIHVSVKPGANGLEMASQTPLSLVGMFFALWKPLDEAQLWK